MVFRAFELEQGHCSLRSARRYRGTEAETLSALASFPGAPGAPGDIAQRLLARFPVLNSREAFRAARSELGETNSRNPRHFNIIEGGRVYQALHIDSKSVLDALCRVKKCLRHSI